MSEVLIIMIFCFGFGYFIDRQEEKVIKQKQFRINDAIYQCKKINEFPKIEE